MRVEREEICNFWYGADSSHFPVVTLRTGIGKFF